MTYTYEKAWEFSLSLVPRIEALALPGTAERATRKPTPDMNVAPHRRHTNVHRQEGHVHNTSHWDIHCCHVLDCTRNLRDSYASSTKRSKRLCHICVIPSPSALGASVRWITPQRYAVRVSLQNGGTKKAGGNARRFVLSFLLCRRPLLFAGRWSERCLP